MAFVTKSCHTLLPKQKVYGNFAPNRAINQAIKRKRMVLYHKRYFFPSLSHVLCNLFYSTGIFSRIIPCILQLVSLYGNLFQIFPVFFATYFSLRESFPDYSRAFYNLLLSTGIFSRIIPCILQLVSLYGNVLQLITVYYATYFLLPDSAILHSAKRESFYKDSLNLSHSLARSY